MSSMPVSPMPCASIRKPASGCYGFHQRGRTNYYVSSGLGIWGGKFRIGTRSEYVVLTLSPQ